MIATSLAEEDVIHELLAGVGYHGQDKPQQRQQEWIAWTGVL